MDAWRFGRAPFPRRRKGCGRSGGLTDVCVHYTAVDAHQHDYRIRVVTDAVAGSDRAAHEAFLRAIRYLQRDALVTTADLESAP